MKKILAVSGGIDSVVMLHMFRNDPEAVVAHFDHGIRDCSSDDCRFVESLAKKYNLPFFSERIYLGPSCSEARARSARYAFLRSLSARLDGIIYTAHHQDDLIESIAINLIRGTGWRGLIPFRDASVERPLLSWPKREIYRYASQHALSFRLDASNTDNRYLRNRVRRYLRNLPATQYDTLVNAISALYRRQTNLATDIEANLAALPLSSPYSRQAIALLDAPVAIEILRYLFARYDIHLTRPQLTRCLSAIRTYRPDSLFSINRSWFLKFGRQHFSIISASA
ncbi:tRNA lysidine(34) synthetase TilS [Candidatus Saccharibacteria bacterium]|nr:tRNA lysidine(34) synthetase TilS [Candidatus Saccharibacteria bacterium]